MKSLTLSIVIPVYNEETNLKPCLEAIAAQTVSPDEVIVVDNNCTDRTIEIARQFNFVTIIEQPIQGLIAARNLGMDTATGSLIARIDADTRIAPNWVKHAKTVFAHSTIDAATGPAMTLTINRDWFPRSRLWSLMYFWFIEATFGIRVLWGANMVVRRSAWRAIRRQACLDDSAVHEDQDLSFLLAGKNLEVVRDNTLLIATEGQTYHDWAKFSEYMRRRTLTRQYHERRGTLNRSKQLLPLRQRIPRVLAILIPGIVFILSSFPLSVISTVLSRLRRELSLAE